MAQNGMIIARQNHMVTMAVVLSHFKMMVKYDSLQQVTGHTCLHQLKYWLVKMY